ncbi:MAG: methylaspartate mutase [Planctomycetota bacterium]|nr:MAG: methylaspartate mutase [Planctomycetota bacterium]
MRVIVATDCGSTTTKAILIEVVDGHYRQTYRGEAPTTVEAPFEDVTIGVLNAIAEIEDLSGRKILDEQGRIITPASEGRGVDIYISTSSAGGGLQMLVAGAVKTMTAESAQRAALGAGAIVMDVLASNDGRLPHEKIERIRELRPDMILLSGGTDGGTVSHVVELAEYIAAANPRPRLGGGYRLPVIYAGNRDAREQVRKLLADKMELFIVDNLRPTLERENLWPARQKIQELFLEHVMAQAPGYKKLMAMTGAPIMPTPAAMGTMIQTIAEQRQVNVLGVDIGGATTDVFSSFRVEGVDEPVFNRTVSANLGMSYSISNVMARAGIDNVLRWVAFETEQAPLRDAIKNKMIRPTTIPQQLEDLQIEQALAREALRGSLEEHRSLAVGLKGVQTERTISEALSQEGSGASLVDMMRLDLIVGSGGVLSHAPRRAQSMMMMLDAFEPEGVTRLAVDSIFMMPHLGVLSTIHPRASAEVFERDCMIPLGTAIAPRGQARRFGARCLRYRVELPGGEVREGELAFGDLVRIPLAREQRATVHLEPARGFDVGAGPKKARTVEVSGGEVGLVLDGRGRPLRMEQDKAKRFAQLSRWYEAMDLYPRLTAATRS